MESTMWIHFFIDGLSGQERAKVCIQRLHDIGIQVTSLTCDGPSCHLSMLRELGLSIDLSSGSQTSSVCIP